VRWTEKKLVRFNVKTFAKYLLIILAGSAIGTLALGLDAEGSFIPQRMCLRAVRVAERAFGRLGPWFEKCGAARPVRVLVEPGVSLRLDPADLVAKDILIRNVWQPEVWQSISDGLSAGGVFLDVGAHIGYDTLMGKLFRSNRIPRH
jgi:hypothetical protein